MADVDWNDSGLLIHGVSAATLQKSLKDQGYANFQIAGLVSSALAGVAWAQPSAFRFATQVEATDPACEVTYRRAFVHDDWADGRSRVQAGTTPDEVGFNARFHALEAELDAVSAQFAGLGRCVAGLRGDLHGVVRELETVVSALRTEVAQLRREQSPKLPRLENWAVQQKVLGYQTLSDGKLKILMQKGEDVTFLDTKEFTANFAQTFDPGRNVKDVARDLGDYVTVLEVDPAVQRRVAFGVSRDELVEEMGGRLLGAGERRVTIAELLADVPGDTTFNDVGALSDAVTTAAVARASGGDLESVRAEVLAPALQDLTAAKVRDAEVTGLVTVTTEVSGVLAGSGFTTIGSLAEAKPTDVLRAAERAGLGLTLAQATEAVGGARMGLKVARLR